MSIEVNTTKVESKDTSSELCMCVIEIVQCWCYALGGTDVFHPVSCVNLISGIHCTFHMH